MEKNISQAYHQANLMTADPGKLIILCYEKAIHHLSLAVSHYENKEYEAKAKNLQKALDIIAELNKSLDMDKGGAIAENLDGLYKYMMAHLLQADIGRNLEGFRHVIGMLRELDAAWKEIILKPKVNIVEKVMPSPFSAPRPAMAAAGGGRIWSA